MYHDRIIYNDAKCCVTQKNRKNGCLCVQAMFPSVQQMAMDLTFLPHKTGFVQSKWSNYFLVIKAM